MYIQSWCLRLVDWNFNVHAHLELVFNDSSYTCRLNFQRVVNTQSWYLMPVDNIQCAEYTQSWYSLPVDQNFKQQLSCKYIALWFCGKHAGFGNALWPARDKRELNITEKQGLKYSTIALTILLRIGKSENSVFRVNALTFWIIIPKIFIIYHLFQHSHVPEQIRNWTIPKIVRNGLNILS